MSLESYRRKLRLAAVLGVCFGIFFLLWRTLLPGGSLVVTSDLVHPAPFVSPPKPQDRLAAPMADSEGRILSPLLRHPLYIDLTPPSRFENVRVTVRYFNTGHGQIELGALASALDEQYVSRTVEQRLVDSLPWSRVEGGGMVLLQRAKRFDSVADFMDRPPDRAKVAVADAAAAIPVRIDGDATGPTRTIDASLRGHHRIITYSGGEPLAMSFLVQDMNRDAGEDPVAVSIYRLGRTEALAGTILEDDGNSSSDQHSSKLRSVSVSLAAPAPGAYQIEFASSNDVFIRKLVTRQRKLVFAERIYLGDLIGYSPGSRSRTVLASGRRLIARTADQESLQTLSFEGNTLSIDEPNTRFMRDLQARDGGVAVRAPKGNVLLEVDGVFALSGGDFFDPFPLRIQWDTSAADLDRRGIDYVLARYAPPWTDGGLFEASADFDMRRLALTRDGDYRFVIGAPGIDESQHEVRIASVTFELTRQRLDLGNFWSDLSEMFKPPESDFAVLPDGRSYGERGP